MKAPAVVALSLGCFVLGFLFCSLFTDRDISEVGKSAVDAGASVFTDDSDSVGTSASGASGSEVAFTIQVSDLSNSQQTMLRGLGIKESEIQITNDMVTCAETKLGASRMAEIRGGAKPSFSEGAQLVVCYNS
jgi:hypothetical protein